MNQKHFPKNVKSLNSATHCKLSFLSFAEAVRSDAINTLWFSCTFPTNGRSTLSKRFLILLFNSDRRRKAKKKKERLCERPLLDASCVHKTRTKKKKERNSLFFFCSGLTRTCEFVQTICLPKSGSHTDNLLASQCLKEPRNECHRYIIVKRCKECWKLRDVSCK